MQKARYFRQNPLKSPDGGNRVLLHSCCAPCSCAIIEALHDSGLVPTVFFYNPNIYPQAEYDLRKRENMRYAAKLGIPFVDADYDCGEWQLRTKGLENEPERGKRCTVCFDMRLEGAARYAASHGFTVFATTLGISRWKNMTQVDECGTRAASNHEGLIYWAFNWRKNGMMDRRAALIKSEEFYLQQYCGCVFSLRDSIRRKAMQVPSKS
jgi:epoxyqueuosine reductase